MKLSIIIPVYNEEKTIGEILEKICLLTLPKLEKEIIVIDDCSTDSTQKILKDLRNKKIKIFRHKENLGKGAAVRTGIKNSTGDMFVVQDADLEYNPQDIIKLLEPIVKKQIKVVYGTRLKEYPFRIFGKEKTVLPTHYIGNKFLTWLTNVLYGSQLTDMETCYKLFTKEAIDKIDLKANRFDIEPEITAKILKKGNNIIELPIKTKPRSYKEGKKINWRDGFIAIWILLKYRFVD